MWYFSFVIKNICEKLMTVFREFVAYRFLYSRFLEPSYQNLIDLMPDSL